MPCRTGRRHNGYWAGDFSQTAPMTGEQLRRLPPMQRRTIVLRHWLGCSVEETARELGISEGTVKSHSSRGLATLRARLGDEVTTA